MLNVFDLTGKVAFVTGAGRGIAAGVAGVLAEAGADVAVNALTPKYLEPLTTRIAANTGRTARAYASDMTKPETVQATVASVLRDFGKIDILVNGIGDALQHPLAALPGIEGRDKDLSDDDLRWAMNINLIGTILTTRAVGPHLLARRSGKVINISSFGGQRGGRNFSIYTAAKAGLNGFTRAMALEWAAFNIQVNAIAPGTFPDPMTMDEERARRAEEQARRTVPLRRNGDPREVGYLAVYLASAASDFMTGQTLPLDGGVSL